MRISSRRFDSIPTTIGRDVVAIIVCVTRSISGGSSHVVVVVLSFAEVRV
jgi:hypothetical protein